MNNKSLDKNAKSTQVDITTLPKLCGEVLISTTNEILKKNLVNLPSTLTYSEYVNLFTEKYNENLRNCTNEDFLPYDTEDGSIEYENDIKGFEYLVNTLSIPNGKELRNFFILSKGQSLNLNFSIPGTQRLLYPFAHMLNAIEYFSANDPSYKQELD